MYNHLECTVWHQELIRKYNGENTLFSIATKITKYQGGNFTSEQDLSGGDIKLDRKGDKATPSF